MRLGNAPASSQAFPGESLSFHRHLMLTLAKSSAEWKNLLYLFEDFVLDADRRELHRKDRVLPVEPKVFDLLVLLIGNRDRVVSKDDLIVKIWNGRIVSESALTTCITAARSVIGDSGETQRLIKTLPRKGIRFVGVVRGKPTPTLGRNHLDGSSPYPTNPRWPSSRLPTTVCAWPGCLNDSRATPRNGT